MGLGRVRNVKCLCGSGLKFKYCCLPKRYEKQAQREFSNIARYEAFKAAVYKKKLKFRRHQQIKTSISRKIQAVGDFILKPFDRFIVGYKKTK